MIIQKQIDSDGNRQGSLGRGVYRAFTMIELLVVIGILIFLGALFLGAAKHITGQAKAQQTRATLEILKSMLENYKSNTHFARQVNLVLPNSGKLGLVLYKNNAGAQNAIMMGQIQAPQAVTADSLGLDNANRGLPVAGTSQATAMDAVLGTEYMLSLLLSSQENQNLYGNLPKNAVTTDAATVFAFTTASKPVGNNGKVILDGWGNPIIFVPGGGLALVMVDPASDSYAVMTSSGLKANGWDPVALQSSAAGAQFEIQPFFVSAGPDADFANTHGHDTPAGSFTAANPSSKFPDMTDDNVYSFQQ